VTGISDAQPPATPTPPATPPTQQRAAPRTLVAWAITAINVAVWLAMEASGGSTRTQTLILFGAKVNSLIAQGEYWRLLTSVFLHIGALHLLFNSIALLSFGRLAETIYGHGRFLAIYLVAGVSGSVLSAILNPRGISAGASGAIFGLAGALAIFFAVNRNKGPMTGQGQLGSIVALLAINAVFGVLNPMIDNWAHAGGLLAGAALAAWLTPRFEPIMTPEGVQIGWRLRRSSVASWAIVPAVAAILAVAAFRIPAR